MFVTKNMHINTSIVADRNFRTFIETNIVYVLLAYTLANEYKTYFRFVFLLVSLDNK